MQKILFFMLVISLSLHGFSQAVITGQVVDANGPAPFANVLLLNPSDSLLIKGAVGDVDGNFQLSRVAIGQYLVKITSVGYGDIFQPVRIESKRQNKDLGQIIIVEDAEKLEEVIVQAERPLFEQKIDRTVVNVQSSITASAGSALDVLEKSPGVTVDRSNDALALAGKQGVRVMINGKMTRMPMQAVVQMLAGMNAENVESIELITTPPAKYEAEGDAGIINIVLKQTEDEGTNGSYSFSAGYGEAEKWGGTVNFNHRKNKLNVFGNYSYLRDHTIQTFGNNRILRNFDGSISETDTQSDRDAVTNTHNAQLGFDYQMGEKTIVGANVSIFDRHWNMDAINRASILRDHLIESRIELLNQEINATQYVVSNLNWAYDFNEKSSLSAEVDYITFDSDNPTDYQQFDFNAQDEPIANTEFRASKITPLSVWVPRLDYSLKLNTDMTLETGLKAAINTLENDVRVENLEGGDWIIDPSLSQLAFLNEDIFAAYSSINFKASPKVDVKAGLRYEHTLTDLDTPEEQNVVDRNFGTVFPSIFINKKINEDNSWVLSYSKRITRPTFQDIAPFVIFLDPNTFWTGNESLLPAITHAVKAEFRHKTYLFSFQYSRDDAAIVGFQPRIDEDSDRQLTSAENMDYRDNYTVTLTLPIQITDWWDMQYNIMGIRQTTFANHLDQAVELTATNVNLNGSNSFTLPRDWKFELSGFYFSPLYFGISRFKAAGAFNLGLEKKLKEDRGTFRLTVTDTFNNRNFIGETLIPEENLDVRRTFFLESGIVNLSFTKNFGNKKLKRIRNKSASSQEERQRL